MKFAHLTMMGSVVFFYSFADGINVRNKSGQSQVVATQSKVLHKEDVFKIPKDIESFFIPTVLGVHKVTIVRNAPKKSLVSIKRIDALGKEEIVLPTASVSNAEIIIESDGTLKIQGIA